jgi:hypothetical protein
VHDHVDEGNQRRDGDKRRESADGIQSTVAKPIE